MDVYIECPVCEEHFYTPDSPPAKQIVCPSCSRKFPMASVIKIDPPLLKPAPKLASPVTGSRLARQATFEKPESFQVEELPELPGLEPADPLSDQAVPFTKPKLPGTTEIRHRYQRRNKRKLIVTLVTGGVLAAAIGILSGLLVIQLQKQSAAAKQDAEDLQSETQPESANADSSSGGVTNNNSASDDSSDSQPKNQLSTNSTADANEKPIRLKDLPPQKLEFLSRQEMDECWETVQPHLVGLRITDARGVHAATATIIDSRGWILTSYSAIVGASKIEVTASAKSIDALPDEELLSDLARGVVAVDPENDLAILSINRRFVISFADIAIAETNRIVEGEYLVQCAPPSKDNPYARSESKILVRDNFDALDAASQAQAKRRKLASPDLTWLVATNDTPPLPGTPLVRPDGTLAAIGVFADKDSGCFLPVDKLKSLIGSAGEEVQPIASLGGSTPGEGQVVSIATTHPMRKVSERLNQLGDTCEQFGWIPQTEAQYKDLQNFAEQITLALVYVMENGDRGDHDVQPIDKLTKQWQNILTKRMAAMDSNDLLALRQMNKMSKEELKQPGAIVPFYGIVYVGGIDLHDKLILRFDADPTFVNISFEPSDDEPMLPDSHWLFFVRTPGNVKVINFAIDRKNIPTNSADLLFSIGPTK